MPTTSKRQRLVAAAAHLGHRVGLSNTSLATIAEQADVPIGNVYYYFKTKQDLAGAVVASRREEYAAYRQSWDEHSDHPVERLVAFVRHTGDAAAELAAHGCPIGGLCNDLARSSEALGAEAGEIFSETIDWAARSYRTLGHSRPRDAAIELVAGLQGATVLAHALQDPRILQTACRRTERDIRSLAAG